MRASAAPQGFWLFDLDRSGSRTVPQMASARPLSRQHIQMLVNPLVEGRYVELVDNPAHKRSKLVRLTPKGRKLVDRMRKRESKVFGVLATRDPGRRRMAATGRSLGRLK
jgi:DNA-binding MarR family transcriptional regulator